MHCKSYSHFFSKTFQHICVSLDVNFNESLTNDIVSFEQLDPGLKPCVFRLLTVLRWWFGHYLFLVLLCVLWMCSYFHFILFCVLFLCSAIYPRFVVTSFEHHENAYNILTPLKSHFYIVKLGFTEVYFIFLIFDQKHRFCVLVRTASPRRL